MLTTYHERGWSTALLSIWVAVWSAFVWVETTMWPECFLINIKLVLSKMLKYRLSIDIENGSIRLFRSIDISILNVSPPPAPSTKLPQLLVLKIVLKSILFNKSKWFEERRFATNEVARRISGARHSATSRAPPTGRCQSDKIHLGDKTTLFQLTVRRVHCVLISLFDVAKINYRVSTASLTRPPSHPRWSISAFYILICLEMTFTNKLSARTRGFYFILLEQSKKVQVLKCIKT